jgi:hypothetical protein
MAEVEAPVLGLDVKMLSIVYNAFINVAYTIYGECKD